MKSPDIGPDEFWDDGTEINSPLGEVKPGFPRYWVILSAADTLTDQRRECLGTALGDIGRDGLSILESIEYGDSYALLSLGVSFDVTPQTVIDDSIITANGLDPFLRLHFFVTNTHKPSEREIVEYIASIS